MTYYYVTLRVRGSLGMRWSLNEADLTLYVGAENRDTAIAQAVTDAVSEFGVSVLRVKKVEDAR